MYNLTLQINGFELKQTCSVCPEQYDVYKDGEEVGYMKNRWGFFRVYVPGPFGKLVYEVEPEGYGEFKDHERMRFLTEGIEAIEKELNQ